MARRADARQPSATPAPPSWLAVPRPDEIYREPECPPSCRCDGVVYTLHFDQPVGPADAPPKFRAQHYTGHAKNLEARLAEHKRGQGARLTQVVVEQGGSWRVADVQPGTRARERQLKQHGAARRCPICKAEAEPQASPRAAPTAIPQPRPAAEPRASPQAAPAAAPEPVLQAEPELQAELEI
jgi:predicted GIY-YIG superfamily endonuclease